MNHVKQFRTIDQQLKLLQDRNFTIEPEQYQDAVSFFLRNNYYRISGYTLTLRQDDMFSDQANLDTLIQIYEADRRMRHIMLSIIEVIEVKAKSVIAYLHSEKYGPLGYKDINNFNCMNDNGINLDMVSEYQRITSKVNRQKSSMLKTEQFIKHHKENRNDILPFWVYVELLTVSANKSVSNFYGGFRSNHCGSEVLRNRSNGAAACGIEGNGVTVNIPQGLDGQVFSRHGGGNFFVPTSKGIACFRGGHRCGNGFFKVSGDGSNRAPAICVKSDRIRVGAPLGGEGQIL